MSDKDISDNTTSSNVSRRSILRNTATLGALSAAVPQVSAQSEAEIDVDSLLQQSSVADLLNTVPDIELDRKRVTFFGSDGSVATVPTNYGKLVLSAPDSMTGASSGEGEASLYFDQWVEDLDKNWKKGTEARLTTTDNGSLLQRGVTSDEATTLLAEINREEFTEENTHIAVTPEKGRLSFTHVDKKEKVVKSVEAVEKTGSSSTLPSLDESTSSSKSLRIVEEETYTGSTEGSEPGLSPQSQSGCGEVLFNAGLCVIDFADCGLCFTTSPAPPVALACYVIVCLDGGLNPLLQALTDFGCLEAVKNIEPCYDDLINQYGDQIPV